LPLGQDLDTIENHRGGTHEAIPNAVLILSVT
jgi:hypothetical protein